MDFERATGLALLALAAAVTMLAGSVAIAITVGTFGGC